MREDLLLQLQEVPVIAAVKNDTGLQLALRCECNAVFILYGNLCTIAQLVDAVKAAGKLAFVHIDLIDGLASRESCVRFLAQYTAADGIISTKPHLVSYAKSIGLTAIQRFFMIDSLAYQNVLKVIDTGQADLIEILPGIIPKLIRTIARHTPIPIIASGLIGDKEDIVEALNAGAIAISSTNQAIWLM